jgi:hypothetical protein
MQFIPVVVVLGAVSWMVCAVSLESETGNRSVWWGRLEEVAHRASSGLGSIRLRVPTTRQALAGRASALLQAAATHAVEAWRGLPSATRSVREGVLEDSAWLAQQARAGRERLLPILRPYGAAVVLAVRWARGWGGEAKAEGVRPVSFAESFSMTAVEELPEEFPEDAMPPLARAGADPGHRIRGVLGLIVLIVLIAALIVAGLMSAAWGVRHLMVRRA